MIPIEKLPEHEEAVLSNDIPVGTVRRALDLAALRGSDTVAITISNNSTCITVTATTARTT